MSSTRPVSATQGGVAGALDWRPSIHRVLLAALVGPGQLKHLYPGVATAEAMRRSTSHLHNTPLQITVERGVIGLVTWLWIFVAFLVRGTALLRRLPAEAGGDRALVLGSLAAVVTFLIAGLFEYNFGDTEVLLVVLALMALPFALVPECQAAGA